MIENKLMTIAKSYDRHFIEHGKKDVLSYDNLPDYITSDPEYPIWKEELENGVQVSDIDIKGYLSPEKYMNFISLGCGVNLTHKGYDKWNSKYHGVDISSETIKYLNRQVQKNNLTIGSLYCCSIHDTPYEDNYFDIGECIGVLEYYKRDYVLHLIKEWYRILKPNARFVFDTINVDSPSGRIAKKIEECMGRPDEFDMTLSELEDMLGEYFVIEDSDRVRSKILDKTHTGMVCFYCLKSKKKNISS